MSACDIWLVICDTIMLEMYLNTANHGQDISIILTSSLLLPLVDLFLIVLFSPNQNFVPGKTSLQSTVITQMWQNHTLNGSMHCNDAIASFTPCSKFEEIPSYFGFSAPAVS